MGQEGFKAAQARLLESVGVEATSRFVDIPSISGRAHVLVSGEGPPVVLLSGIGNPGVFWAHLLARLAGVTAYAVDLPNIGLTDRAPVSRRGARGAAVEFLEQLLDGLGLESPALVGNSLGSVYAIWLALDRPSRVGSTIHVGCPAFVPGWSAPLPFRLLAVRPLGQLLVRLTPPSRKQAENTAAMVGEDFSGLPAVTDLMVAAQQIPGAQSAVVRTLQALTGFAGPRPEIALTPDELGRIGRPTLLIWGGRDPFGGAELGRRTAGLVPGARLEVIPEAAHAPWFTHGERVAELTLSFLRASPSSEG